MTTLDPAERTLPTRVVQGAAAARRRPRRRWRHHAGPRPRHADRRRRAGRAGRPRRARSPRPCRRRGVGHRHPAPGRPPRPAGPRYAPGWEPVDVAAGLTGAVAMMGLAGQRAAGPCHPAPARPARQRAATRRSRPRSPGTGSHGHAGPRHRPGPRRWPPGAARARQVAARRRSADVLALALADSDNALTEALARQAAACRPHGRRAGLRGGRRLGAPAGPRPRASTSPASPCRTPAGCPAAPVIPARVLGRRAGARPPRAAARAADVVAGLPVAGLTGTLHDRFRTPRSRPAAGIARAKTGTLTGASAMAGTVVDARRPAAAYVVLADGSRRAWER